jgi:hypothetical protein
MSTYTALSELNKKSKMVSFRLSGEEYRLLQGACSKTGARSVSELARAAMQRIIMEGDFRPGSPESELRELKLKFNVLSAEVQRLARLIRSESERAS